VKTYTHTVQQPGPRWKRIVRIAVSAVLLVVLLVRVDWATVLAHLRELQPAVIALVIFLFAAQLALSAWKWQWALRIHELRFDYGFLSRVLVIGFFLNNFLPTSIGGDAYRVYRTLPPMPPRSSAVSAVLLERVIGLCALLALGFIAALTLYSANSLARIYVAVGGCGIAVAIVLAALLFVQPFKGSAPRFLQSRWLAPVMQNLRSIAQARAAWVPLIALSLLFQAQAIYIVYLLFGSLDAHVTLAQAALIAAAAGLAVIVPLSINGIGIVEATIAGAGVAVGVSYEAGLLVALLMRVLILPLTLLAGLLYAFEPRQPIVLSDPQPKHVRSPG
jgi:uncharacterized protein (TIRG00374 family)